ncbi:MAG TPA: DUF3565 domain-containing protein [Anaerolineae bacterium]|nr:DUF3565 domain-containing protein [Anaerolineae bacterium]
MRRETRLCRSSGRAELPVACRHQQHIRHNPPLVSRPWVLTPEGREQFLGFELECKKCDEGAPRDW